MRFCVFIFFLGIASESVLESRASAPKIQFDRTVCDFGKTSQVQQVTGSFSFRNVGDAVLKLSKPSTTCGCTEAAIKPESVEPGEKGEVTFTVSMPSARRTLNQEIEVSSNDPRNPKAVLTVRVEYVPLFEIQPLHLNIAVRSGQTTNLAALARRTDGKPLIFTRVEPTKPWIKAKVEKGNASGTEAHIRIEATPDGKPRHFAEWVRLYTDSSDTPAVTAVLIGQVLGDVRVSPEMLHWIINKPAAGSPPEAALTRRIRIRSTVPGQVLEVRNVASTLKGLQLDLEPIEKATSYDLQVRLSAAPEGLLQGKITFETNLASQPSIEIPVNIVSQTTPQGSNNPR